MRRDLTALAWLSWSAAIRLVREPLVVRSLAWPVALTSTTLLALLIVAAAIRRDPTVAVRDLDPAFAEDLSALGWTPRASAHPLDEVLGGDANAGMDGATLWIAGGSASTLALEALVRERAGADWRPSREVDLPSAGSAADGGTQIIRLLALLFALYGVVFGLGTVARDRDDGSLDAELAAPIRRWVPAASRWLSGSVVLVFALSLSLAVFDALIGVAGAAALWRSGAAAAMAATAIGLATIGNAGLARGFSGAISFALVIAAALTSVATAAPALARYLPLASLFVAGDGWVPLAVAAAMGVGACALFAWRTRT